MASLYTRQKRSPPPRDAIFSGLAKVVRRLAERGDTLVIVEHHPDVRRQTVGMARRTRLATLAR